MSRLIDAESLSKLFLDTHQSGNTCDPQDVIKAIANAPTVEQDSEPVAAQHRFRYPRKHEWSKWQQCEVGNRPAYATDSQGYEVEYRELYTSPPKREWRGLSDEDLLECMDYGKNYIPSKIEARLKELNDG